MRPQDGLRVRSSRCVVVAGEMFVLVAETQPLDPAVVDELDPVARHAAHDQRVADGIAFAKQPGSLWRRRRREHREALSGRRGVQRGVEQQRRGRTLRGGPLSRRADAETPQLRFDQPGELAGIDTAARVQAVDENAGQLADGDFRSRL